MAPKKWKQDLLRPLFGPYGRKSINLGQFGVKIAQGPEYKPEMVQPTEATEPKPAPKTPAPVGQDQPQQPPTQVPPPKTPPTVQENSEEPSPWEETEREREEEEIEKQAKEEMEEIMEILHPEGLPEESPPPPPRNIEEGTFPEPGSWYEEQSPELDSILDQWDLDGFYDSLSEPFFPLDTNKPLSQQPRRREDMLQQMNHYLRWSRSPFRAVDVEWSDSPDQDPPYKWKFDLWPEESGE